MCVVPNAQLQGFSNQMAGGMGTFKRRIHFIMQLLRRVFSASNTAHEPSPHHNAVCRRAGRAVANLHPPSTSHHPQNNHRPAQT